MLAKYPFLVPVIGCLIGIFSQESIGETYLFIICLVSLLCLLFFFSRFFRKSQYSSGYLSLKLIIYLLIMIVLGATITNFKQQRITNTIIDKTKIQSFKGFVKEIGTSKYGKLKTIVTIGDEQLDILCYFKVSSKSSNLEIGDSIIFNAKLSNIENLSIDSVNYFDFKKHMYHKDILYKVTLYNDEWIKNWGKQKSIYTHSQYIRNKIIYYFENELSIKGESLGLVSALLLGAQHEVSEDLTEAFRKSGTVHVLSVSGLHVSLIYSFFIFIITLIPILNKKARILYILIIFFLVFYCFITGLSPSVLRASIMLIILCVANIIGKNNNSLNNLFCVGFFMLIYNPFVAFDIGFQLSFTAVFFILVLYPLISEKPICKYNFVNKIKDMFLLSVVAQLGTFPLILYYFGNIPIYFFIANLIIVPIANFLIICIIVNCIVSYFLSFVAILIPHIDSLLNYMHTVFNLIVDLFISIVYFFSNLPHATIEDFYYSKIEVLLSYIALLTFILYLKQKRYYYLHFSLCCILAILIFNFTNIYHLK